MARIKARTEAAIRAARLVWTAAIISADYKTYYLSKVDLAEKHRMFDNSRNPVVLKPHDDYCAELRQNDFAADLFMDYRFIGTSTRIWHSDIHVIFIKDTYISVVYFQYLFSSSSIHNIQPRLISDGAALCCVLRVRYLASSKCRTVADVALMSR